MWVVRHNDFWNKDTSNWGCYFVCTEKHAAAYDSPVDEVAVWMPKSPWLPDTPEGREKHLAHNRLQERRAKIIADALNAEA